MPNPTNTPKFGQSQSPYTSKLILWDGPDIPCIELCKGDMVSDVMYKIGERLCEVYTDYEDLKNLDFTCIVEKLSLTQPTDFSFKALFQLLLDNDCKLEELIQATAIAAQETAGIDVTALDLSCLTPDFTACEDCNPEDVVSILQKLIDRVCNHETRITTNETNITDLEIRVTTVEDRTDPNGPIVEAEITSCLNPSPNTPQTVSNHIENITDPALCDLRAIVGSNTDLNTAFSRICPDDFKGLPGFFETPTTVAENISSMWVMMCEMYETQLDCCKTTCGKVKVGFGTTYNTSSQVITLIFSGTYGNDIPNDLNDCGSKITITDVNNQTATGVFVLEDSVSVDINLSALDTTQALTISVKYCLSNDEITCQDCVVEVLDKLTDPVVAEECTICRYMVSGPAGEFAVISYTLNGNPVTKTIHTGETITFKIPDEQVIIQSLLYSDPGVVFAIDPSFPCGSDVIEIPDPIQIECYFFPIPARDVGQSVDIDAVIPTQYTFDADYISHTFDETQNNVTYSKLTYDGIDYPLTGYTTNYTDQGFGSKDRSSVEGGSDNLTTFPILPSTGIPTTATNVQTCGNINYSFSDNNSDGRVSQSVGAINDYPDLKWTITPSGRYGIIMKLPTAGVPEIEIIDSVTNNKMYIKGEPMDCQCP